MAGWLAEGWRSWGEHLSGKRRVKNRDHGEEILLGSTNARRPPGLWEGNGIDHWKCVNKGRANAAAVALPQRRNGS